VIALLWLGCAKSPSLPPLPAGEACTPDEVRTSGELCAYDIGLLRIASAFAAKEACSCVFVAGLDEDTCADWVRVSPAVATFRVDRDGKRVVAHALGLAKVSATWVDEATGCRLDQ
jgi:hypothetical protein